MCAFVCLLRLALLDGSTNIPQELEPDWKQLLTHATNSAASKHSKNNKNTDTVTAVSGEEYKLPKNVVRAGSGDSNDARGSIDVCLHSQNIENLRQDRLMWGPDIEISSRTPAMPTFEYAIRNMHGEIIAADTTTQQVNAPANQDIQVEEDNVLDDNTCASDRKTRHSLDAMTESALLTIDVPTNTDSINSLMVNINDESPPGRGGTDTGMDSVVNINNSDLMSNTKKNSGSNGPGNQSATKYVRALSTDNNDDHSDDDWHHVDADVDIIRVPTASAENNNHNGSSSSANNNKVTATDTQSLYTHGGATHISSNPDEANNNNDITRTVAADVNDRVQVQLSTRDNSYLANCILRTRDYYQQQSEFAQSLQPPLITKRYNELLTLRLQQQDTAEGDEDVDNRQTHRNAGDDRSSKNQGGGSTFGHRLISMFIPENIRSRIQHTVIDPITNTYHTYYDCTINANNKYVSIGSKLLITAVIVAGVSYGVSKYTTANKTIS
jgi:hypothetical protein